MYVTSTNLSSQVTFKHTHALKTAWLRGELPNVKYGLYGGQLTPENISLEHLRPRSKGGHTELSNLALATRQNNMKRSSLPLSKVLTIEQASRYLKQFQGQKASNLDGDYYIKRVTPTLARLLSN